MEAPRFLLPDVRALDEARAELCACTVFTDERPFRGVAGLLDWRMLGKLSVLARDGYITGALGEVVMVPGRPRLSFDKVLVFGLGPRATFAEDTLRAWLKHLRSALGGLHVRRAVVEMAGRTLLPPARRAQLFVETNISSETEGRFVLVEDEEGQRQLAKEIKRTELRPRSA